MKEKGWCIRIKLSEALIDRGISLRYTQKEMPLALTDKIGIWLIPVFLFETVGIIGSIAVSSFLLSCHYISFFSFMQLLLGMDLHKMMNVRLLKSTILSAFVSQFLLQSIVLIVAKKLDFLCSFQYTKKLISWKVGPLFKTVNLSS